MTHLKDQIANVKERLWIVSVRSPPSWISVRFWCHRIFFAESCGVACSAGLADSVM